MASQAKALLVIESKSRKGGVRLVIVNKSLNAYATVLYL
jgi:hypothetical protein